PVAWSRRQRGVLRPRGGRRGSGRRPGGRFPDGRPGRPGDPPGGHRRRPGRPRRRPRVSTIAFVLRSDRPGVDETTTETTTWLLEGGHEVRLLERDAERLGHPELAVTERELAPGADLAVSLGGDGTMLRTVSLVAAEGVPVMGVNHGRLGYLTSI